MELAKLYIEPTNQCNMRCRTCIRNVWDEALGKMSDAVFDRIIEGLRARGFSLVTVPQLLGRTVPGKTYFRR